MLWRERLRTYGLWALAAWLIAGGIYMGITGDKAPPAPAHELTVQIPGDTGNATLHCGAAGQVPVVSLEGLTASADGPEPVAITATGRAPFAVDAVFAGRIAVLAPSSELVAGLASGRPVTIRYAPAGALELEPGGVRRSLTRFLLACYRPPQAPS